MALKISVVTPSFNQAGFVEETIKSVLDQNYPALEYIVVDGGSADGSAEIIGKYRDRLHYFVSEPDGGHGPALNKGFAQSSGEIMAWLNSDDKYLPWTLRTVSEIFEQFPDINWITGTSAFFNVHGALTRAMNIYKNVHDFHEGDYAWVQQESVFWRRSLWDRAGGQIDENYKLMVDGELWTRFFLHDPLWHVHRPLAGYRKHPGARSNSRHDERVLEMQRAIDVMRERIDPQRLAAAPKNYPVLEYDDDNSSWKRLAGLRGAPK